MNGIEKITGQIEADVQREIDDLTAQAQAQAAEILADYEARARAEAEATLKRGALAAAQREERLGDMARLEATERDAEDIAAFLGQIEGVRTSVTIRELAEGGCKLSVRTSGGLNATKVCARLGGGGHAAAAGCTVSGTLAEAEAARAAGQLYAFLAVEGMDAIGTDL